MQIHFHTLITPLRSLRLCASARNKLELFFGSHPGDLDLFYRTRGSQKPDRWIFEAEIYISSEGRFFGRVGLLRFSPDT